MRSIAERVARRFFASTIKILVDVPATVAVRERFSAHPEAVIATFATSITLYRIFDDAELIRILSSGKITGGTYSVKAERAHGASWGENITAVIEWGNALRNKRLGGDLFLAKLGAGGFRFFHLDPEIGPIDPNGPNEQPAAMDRARISTALGASVMDVGLHDVGLFVVHPNHQLTAISVEEAKEYVAQRPKKDVDLREIHHQLLQGTILGVDVRVWFDKGKWGVYTNEDRQFVFGANTKEDAIELAKMGIHMRPANPMRMDAVLLEHKRRYEKHFEQDEDPDKIRGAHALKPRDKVRVTKGSNNLGIKSHSQGIVADVFQLKGESRVMVKILFDDRPVTLYAIHSNRLADPEIPLMNSRGDRILIQRR